MTTMWRFRTTLNDLTLDVETSTSTSVAGRHVTPEREGPVVCVPLGGQSPRSRNLLPHLTGAPLRTPVIITDRGQRTPTLFARKEEKFCFSVEIVRTLICNDLILVSVETWECRMVNGVGCCTISVSAQVWFVVTNLGTKVVDGETQSRGEMSF